MITKYISVLTFIFVFGCQNVWELYGDVADNESWQWPLWGDA